jgi:L-arabinose isomerase
LEQQALIIIDYNGVWDHDGEDAMTKDDDEVRSRLVEQKRKNEIRPKIGLLPTGHFYYWPQFPELKDMGLKMYSRLLGVLKDLAQIVAPDLVDTAEKSRQAGELFKKEVVDMVLIYPLGYTPSMNVVPAVKDLDVPIRILNAHEDKTYDYTSADTTIYLHHEGVCCVPEYSGAIVNLGKKFRVRTGFFDDPRLKNELKADFTGAAAARFFKNMNVGLIGEVYTHMSDMPVDEHRLLRATGRMLKQPEVEEIENAFHRVKEKQLEDMYRQFRTLYDVDKTVSNEHMKFSAQAAIAYEEVITRHDIFAFGYYWWGERELVTQLRAQSNLAVSRLAALGRPGVTEGDVKSAMAMKIMDLFGAGGMFVEFFSMDFEEGFILMGHDGPSNINMAEGKPRLQHLKVHHGKSGHGLGIDFDMKEGPVTLLNLTQFDAGDTFKLIYSIGEIIPGTILGIGNPNCRVRVQKPIHEFMDEWCRQGPSHHIAIGYGDRSHELEIFAEALKFELARV